jgi:hypothetical protein
MPKQVKRRAIPTDAELPTPTKQKPVAPPAGAVWISARQVLDRYGGRSEMWLNRKLYGDKKSKPDADFPKPAYSGRLRFFRLDELERYDRKIVVRGKTEAEA